MRWIGQMVAKLGRGNTVILIGGPDHVRRCCILARHYGLRPLIPRECESIPYDPRVRPGYQWWAARRCVYLLWEYCLARPKLILDALLGKL
jgi:hypothetical protein